MATVVVALGGNTLLRGGEGSIAEQREQVDRAANRLAPLRERGDDLVVTHGNGPQVGDLLLQQEGAEHPRPLDVLVAETQAQIGYLLAQALAPRLDGAAAAVVTQSVVDPDDPAFDDPSKPVGPYYSAEEAESKAFETTAVTRPDGSTAHRRVVPSPEPTAVVESERIASLVGDGRPVVCAGGGGVPVVREDDDLRGVPAVIDKDHTARVLGDALGADELLFLTDVDCTYLNFGESDQRPIHAASVDEMRRHLDAGEFGEGSMRPKVEAAVRFVADGGERAVITSPERLPAALDGEAGTRIT
ncbi:MAG: carbamate kinase [Halobacteriaceae archaeon]